MDYPTMNKRMDEIRKMAKWIEFKDGKVGKTNRAIQDLVTDIEKADRKEISGYDWEKIVVLQEEVEDIFNS